MMAEISPSERFDRRSENLLSTGLLLSKSPASVPLKANSPDPIGGNAHSQCLRCGQVKYPDQSIFEEIAMKQLFLGSLMMCFAALASAHGCPGEMRAIDAKVPTANLPAADLYKVKALREEGEKLHKEGKHTESMKALMEAKKLLGV
jgi:hypothetical protein